MSEQPVIESRTPSGLRKHFTLLFMLTMLLAGAAVFVAFTNAARTSKAERRATSATNLKVMFHALKAFSKDTGGAYPKELSTLHPRYISDASTFIHPSWPERVGYVYVSGFKDTDEIIYDPERILIYENVPEGKKQLGRQVLTSDGQVHVWNDADFQQRLRAQQFSAAAQKREIELVPVDATRVLPR
jgi:hypothetical protein